MVGLPERSESAIVSAADARAKALHTTRIGRVGETMASELLGSNLFTSVYKATCDSIKAKDFAKVEAGFFTGSAGSVF